MTVKEGFAGCVEVCLGLARPERYNSGSAPGLDAGLAASLLDTEVVVLIDTAEIEREWANRLGAVSKGVTALRWRT